MLVLGRSHGAKLHAWMAFLCGFRRHFAPNPTTRLYSRGIAAATIVLTSSPPDTLSSAAKRRIAYRGPRTADRLLQRPPMGGRPD